MVEIALCIAVVAFAMVAIIGVLPTGVRVQKDNREDTIINQDGTFLLEAIRSGAKGMDELTNYVDLIRVVDTDFGTRQEWVLGDGRRLGATNTFENGYKVVGVLSSPKYEYNYRDRNNPSPTLYEVSAFVRSLSGSAEMKPDLSRKRNVGATLRDTAFKYYLTTEIVPFSVWRRTQATNYASIKTNTIEGRSEWTNRHELWAKSVSLKSNLWDVRLTLHWPVYQFGNSNRVGNNHKTFRALVSGRLAATNLDAQTRLYFFEPPVFVRTR